MLDIEELEQQWKIYKRKQKRPFYIFGLLLVLGITIWYLMDGKSNLYDMKIKHFFTDISSQIFTDKKTKKEDKAYTQEKIIFLLNDFKKEAVLTTDIVKTKEKEKNNLLPLDEDELYVEKDISKPIIYKKKISIIKVANNNAYRDVERRFKRSHNINDSMFLANMYYKKRLYKKAIYWSIQTNKLDKNIEENWLIFAKSKVKLGKKNEAIRVLKAYIKRSNSYEARKLLKKITNS